MKAFERLGGRTLIAFDGTEFFCSQKLGCAHCLTRKRANGKTDTVELLCRIDTEVEVEYYRHGGILPYVLRGLLKAG